MENLYEAVDYIISEGKELEAIDLLIASHRNKYIQLREDCRSAASSLKAIYKINASNNKDKQIAIEALSEEYKGKEEISLQEQEKTQDMIKCDHDWYFDKAIPLTRGTAYHYRCSKCGALRKRFCSDDGCVYESTGEWQP